jgi:hypothetical protein
MSAFNEHESGDSGLLSWTVVAVHCTHCDRSTPMYGLLDKVWLLWRHGKHLGSVSLDLVLTEPRTHASSTMRLRLLPLDLQILSMN